MKFFSTTMTVFIVAWFSMLVGTAVADPGYGVCAFGNGASLGVNVDGTFTGVNVAAPTADPTGVFGFGQGSETGVYSAQEDYEAQCCAETGQEPDCFEPVA